MSLKKVDKIPKKYQALCVYLLLALVTIAVFWQVGSCDFISYDDSRYIRDNEHVNTGLSWENVIWAFTKSYASNWHPLTWLSHMLDCQLFGMAPAGHHLTNLLLHVANTLLLFAVLKRMTGAVWRSVFVAAAFAIHPLHIESVAWVAERKDVLSTLFWILTMGAYLGYVNRPNKSRYALTVVVFGLGLMAKPMLVTLPLVLLLLDYWPLGRFQKASHHKNTGRTQKGIFGHLLLEKVPLLLLSAGSCAITYFVQQKGGSVAAINAISPAMRISNAVFSYAKYIGKMIWPSRLAVFYPHPGDKLPLWMVVLIAMLLFAISIWVIKLAKKRGYLTVGWFWYIITLLPVIGIVQVGLQAMADRYTYVPLTGLFIIVAWGLADISTKWPYRKAVLTILSVTVLSAMAIASRLQVRHWRNSVTIFEHALKVTDDNYVAYSSLVKPLFKQGRIDEAMAYNYQALRINPNDDIVHVNLGFILSKIGKFDEAVKHYARALQIKPDNPAAYKNMGNALLRQGKATEAIEQYQQVLRLLPDNAQMYNDIGTALGQEGKLDQAITHFRKALEIEPEFAKAHYNLGYALRHQGKFDQAVEHYTRAIQITPDDPDTYKNLADMLIQQGKIAEAIEQYQQVLRLTPDNAQVHNDLGLAFGRGGKLDQAAAHFNKALQINPEFAMAHCNLGYALRRQGKFDQAVEHYTRAIQITPDDLVTYKNLADILIQQGKISEAIEQYQQVLRLTPDNAQVHNDLGLAFGREGKLNQAITHFRKALALEPEFAKAHHNLGYALRRQNKLDEAFIHLESSIELDPNYAPVYQVLGQILSQQGRMNEAAENFRRVLRLEPDHIEVLNALAWMLAVHKSADFHDPNQATGLAERACELSGYEQPAVLDTLACAYAASGRFSEAIATAEKALELARSKEQDQHIIDSIQNNLNLFQAGKPYYEE